MPQRKISNRSSESVTKKAKFATAVHQEEMTQAAAPLEGELKILFGPRRYVVYSHYNGHDLIHIREYGVKSMPNAMGQCEYPTKKGICLTPSRLKMLWIKINEIDESLNRRDGVTEQRLHLGNGLYVSTGKLAGVDLRRYWIPEGQTDIVATKRGIFVTEFQWRLLKEKLGELLDAYPTLGAADVCYHDNQPSLAQCRECLPFGYCDVTTLNF